MIFVSDAKKAKTENCTKKFLLIGNILTRIISFMAPKRDTITGEEGGTVAFSFITEEL